MFSVSQKREISDAIQKILRDTNHPELPDGEIRFRIHIIGENPSCQWADIVNNGHCVMPSVNPHNEALDACMHANVKTGYDLNTCRDCGMILTDSCWGCASRMWFKNKPSAEYFRKNGFLPK